MKIEHNDLINLGDIYEESAKGKDIDSVINEDAEQKQDENLEEGVFDRIGDRVSAAAGTAKDAWGNVKASAKNVKQTMSGDKPTGRGTNLGYSYDQRKAERVITRHLGKIKRQLSDFATDLTKLGVVTADEAEKIAQQAYSAVEKTRTLKKTKNLYDVD
jgi:hypothetical protein